MDLQLDGSEGPTANGNHDVMDSQPSASVGSRSPVQSPASKEANDLVAASTPDGVGMETNLLSSYSFQTPTNDKSPPIASSDPQSAGDTAVDVGRSDKIDEVKTQEDTQDDRDRDDQQGDEEQPDEESVQEPQDRQQNEDKVERRSKRQRIDALAKRFTPGEGGGLGSKAYDKSMTRKQRLDGEDDSDLSEDSASGEGGKPDVSEKMIKVSATEEGASKNNSENGILNTNQITTDSDENPTPQSLLATKDDQTLKIKIKGKSIPSKVKSKGSAEKKSKEGGNSVAGTVTSKESRISSNSKGKSSSGKSPSGTKSKADAISKDKGSTQKEGKKKDKKGSQDSSASNSKKTSSQPKTKKMSNQNEGKKTQKVGQNGSDKKAANKSNKSQNIQQKSQGGDKKQKKKTNKDPSSGTAHAKTNKNSGPTYRWLDEGLMIEDPTIVATNPDHVVIQHRSLEIDYSRITAGSPEKSSKPRADDSDGKTGKTGGKRKMMSTLESRTLVLNIGDTVLMSSSEKTSPSECESVPLYDDPSSRDGNLGDLDPFVGRIEKMWDEIEDPLSLTGSAKKSSSGKLKKGGKNAGSSKMMIRTRWFFKKEDMEGLDGRFSIEGQKTRSNMKSKVIASMTHRDLIRTDLTDDNSVSTILGRAQVVRRKPLGPGERTLDEIVPEGNFVCRYDLQMQPATLTSREAVVTLIPCEDELEAEKNANLDSDDRAMKRVKLETDQASSDANQTSNSGMDWKRAESTDPATSGISSEDDTMGGTRDDGLMPLQPPSSPFRQVTSEGATTIGKIQVGPEFQAIVPEKPEAERKSLRLSSNPPSQREPIMVWNPNMSYKRGVDVERFLGDACAILIKHLKELKLESFHVLNSLESPDSKAEAKRPRECNISCLLSELHENNYDTDRTLKRISNDPEKFMTIWNGEEKEQFNTSFRTYRESLRMISKNIDGSKSCKDVVDYYYRYKLPENFRRYKVKKREQAQRIMMCAEDRMLNEKMIEESRKAENEESDEENSDEEDDVAASTMNGTSVSAATGASPTKFGAVNNRLRTFFRTGGGDENSVGALQTRRNRACDVLLQIQKEVGPEAYIALAKCLKSFYSQAGTSLSDVRNTAEDVMKLHPDLLGRFMDFLPKDVRCV